ncbi:putative nuclease harbi1 [Aphanomyces cochlioides]|nr:putative nuclease harbi1 [Aphanomyces cochlioides]
MLHDSKYDQWFLHNLRCSQATFTSLVAMIRVFIDQNYQRQSRHSFEKKVAMLLYFLGSEGGYREVSAAFGVSKTWCIEIIGVMSVALAKAAKEWIKLPRDSDEWNAVERGFYQDKIYLVSWAQLMEH